MARLLAGGAAQESVVNGGAPIVLCASAVPFGASWAYDNTILYGQGPGGIWRVSAAGGTPENLVKVNAGERAHGPQLLPGGRAVLFTLAQGGEGWDDAQIVVHSFDGGARQVVVPGGTDARYLPTGHLLYALRGSLLAQQFDIGRLEVTGGPVPIVDDVAQSVGGVSGAAQFAVSADGTLVYVPASSLAVAVTARFVWVDRMGHEEPVSAPPRCTSCRDSRRMVGGSPISPSLVTVPTSGSMNSGAGFSNGSLQTRVGILSPSGHPTATASPTTQRGTKAAPVSCCVEPMAPAMSSD